MSADKMPSKIYNSFTDKFLSTIQEEVIQVIESSVRTMPHQRAFDLFNLNNTQELKDFVVKHMENAEVSFYLLKF